MSVVSGPVTFGSPGVKVIALGIAAQEVEFFPDSSDTYGHADPAYQLSRTPGINNDHTKISIFNTSGVKVVEFTVTAWGATTITCNVTLTDGRQIPLVART